MKIAVIIDAWHPIIGGSQTHVWELSSQLVENYGCSIDIFTRALKDDKGEIFNDNESFFGGKLRVFRVGPATILSSFWGRALTLLTMPIKLAQENKRNRYDLIHAHSILAGLMGKAAKYLTGIPLVFTVHGSMNTDRGVKNLDYFIEKTILTKIRYDKEISVGKGFFKYRNVNKNIEFIPNGVDVNKFDSVEGPTKSTSFKVLFVGRLHWQKGIDTLIEALRMLKEENSSLLHEKNLQVQLIGYGFDIEKYKEMSHDYNISDILLFRGKVTGESLIMEYKSSHLFILPSVCEGQPITLLEAMASRLPVLTTYSADNANIVETTMGWKVREQKPQELAYALLEILRLSQENLEMMGEMGHQNISKNYTWDTVAENTFNIYTSLRRAQA